MRPVFVVGATALLVAALAGCSKSATPTTNPTTPAAVAAAASPTATASAAASGAPTTIDPCQLVTQAEASTLTGASYGPGKLEIDSPASRRCVYGGQTKNVFEVIVAQAATADEAQSEKNALLAQAQGELGGQLNLSPVTGVGDQAESINASIGGQINASGIYVLKGLVGFALVDEVVGGPAPTVAALTTQAQTVVSRLP
jgi:hypothetical protein